MTYSGEDIIFVLFLWQAPLGVLGNTPDCSGERALEQIGLIHLRSKEPKWLPGFLFNFFEALSSEQSYVVRINLDGTITSVQSLFHHDNLWTMENYDT